MEPLAEQKKSAGSSSILAPGFRFHPTDEELVRYYLRRKVCGKGFRFDAISDVDIYRIEPWDLPSFSKLKTRDLEWYFFSGLDKKYGNGAKTNRATEKGYWKTTGKDRDVYHKRQIVGMKKTLVFHSGRAPKGQRTNWVMHEYRLVDSELDRVGIAQDAYVLCRVFQKSGSGPKNGEQYGAPFVEEEWEDDELEFVPKAEVAEEVDFGDDAYLDAHDLEQILGSDVPSDISPLPLDIQTADASYVEETAESIDDTQQLVVNTSEQHHEPEPHVDANIYGLSDQYDMDVQAVKHEYIGESSKSLNFDGLEYLLDEPFFDSSDDLQFGNGGFLEANDLSNPIENNTTSDFDMLEEYLTFLDADDGNTEHFTYDPSIIPASLNAISNQALLPLKELNDEAEHSTSLDGQINVENAAVPLPNRNAGNNDNDVALLSNKVDTTKHESDFQYPFIQKASHMLGSIPAPPALAAEFPSKEAVRRLNSLSQPSSSVHFTAGMIQIQNLTSDISKSEKINIVLSFGLSRGVDGSASLESSLRILPGKTLWSISRGWFYFICLWALILSISFKIGTCIIAK